MIWTAQASFNEKVMFWGQNSKQTIDFIFLLWKIPYSISQSWDTYHVFPPCQFWNELQIRKYGLGQFHNEKFNCNRLNTTTSVLPTKILVCWGHLKFAEGIYMINWELIWSKLRFYFMSGIPLDIVVFSLWRTS